MKKWMLLILTTALLLSGCAAAPGTTVPQLATKPTVEDLFTQPVKTLPAGTGSHNATRPTDATEPTNTTTAPQTGVGIPLGGMGFGIDDDSKQLDESGSYYVYDGGQMCLRFMVQSTGQATINCVEKGIGIQLMLDGQPQPYRLSEDGDLAYFHIVYPEFDVEAAEMTQWYYFDLYFTPVAGKAGDVVELYCTTICNPNRQLSEPFSGFNHTFGAVQIGTRLKLNAKPPKVDKPDVTERINSVDISYVDTSYAEIAGWSDTDLIEKYEYEFLMNGQPEPGSRSALIYEVSAEKDVELHFEVWGTPYVEYGLMFYVDNQPISAKEVIHFSMKSGQKTVITVMMDVSDFDGESVIYAALIPRNCRSTDILTYAFLDVGSTYFLVDDPKPEK